MRERDDLDMHVMVFPKDCPTGYEWRVKRLAEDRLAEGLRALEVNRSEKRAHVGTGPVVPEPTLADKIRQVNKRLKARQQSLFGGEEHIDKYGRRVER
jgi:hypothetical protein